ncbi:nitrogen regulation protein NR(I) [Tepidimonas taiwanensis]|uniref:DNA-binding transcriptional regulator NtrC n=1 Tax=Tepidimonas taiwanensis TaxID=307486 RepID=A0A554XC40_9BURK|nr:nitrogen regulation protein NR(I) [Tepidimonas taiwanensis]MCX7692750.1 nitrogen regulation protein NR(I) [Tepidimonas taiwanensis]MDM7462558.1 nitrogen regulation protein NR(I) [Tepidimonas taiwanensis]TSE33378.1 Nitrogen regulation protein NR(I) [Tepidimonas taiwanensis]UBQ04419.1 nitrogen regulation protein NR(I) [Tepidimonas taiwanensis]
MKPIWIADDDPSIRFVLEKALAREDLPTRSFDSPKAVLDALADGADEGPQVLVSDIRMPGGSGLDLLEKVKRRYPNLPVIIMTAYSDLDSAVAAFQGGAFEYLPKPFDLPKAVELIRRAVEESQRDEVAQEALAATPEILGQAPAMQDVFRAIGRLSQSHVTVLITGESGTGKELVARALHKHSPRAKGPFVAINTAAIPKDLLESELFGHERGAFTGAQTLRRGRFEQAEGGTLFLDEIGDMPFELQTRLLRVLSDGHYYRVGGHSALKANVRVIAATHQNLEQRVKEGAFREDLYHRLNVIRLRLPPLRERREDIPLLARFFLQQSARQLEVEPKRLSDAALRVLQAFDFPGNVRQLENLCHWLTVMAPAQVVEVKDLPPEVRAASRATPGREGAGASLTAGVPVAAMPSEPAVSAAAWSVPLPAETADLPTTPHGTTEGGGVPTTPQAAAVPTFHRRASGASAPVGADWEAGLMAEATALLAEGCPDVWDTLVRRVEARLIQAALQTTRGRRIEAAQRLGIGRNTITRKMQELGME